VCGCRGPSLRSQNPGFYHVNRVRCVMGCWMCVDFILLHCIVLKIISMAYEFSLHNVSVFYHMLKNFICGFVINCRSLCLKSASYFKVLF
jgi:hypothetical protein